MVSMLISLNLGWVYTYACNITVYKISMLYFYIRFYTRVLAEGKSIRFAKTSFKYLLKNIACVVKCF